MIIGSAALRERLISSGNDFGFRIPVDTDIICSHDEMMSDIAKIKKLSTPMSFYPISGNKFVLIYLAAGDRRITEYEITYPGTTALLISDFDKSQNEDHSVASFSTLYVLKMSHRYLKNSPHFLKTMSDIRIIRKYLSPEEMEACKDLISIREKETLNYDHPNLSTKKNEFFTSNVDYVYDHDSIHVAVKIGDLPAYKYFQERDSEVKVSKKLWDDLDDSLKLNAVLEEAYVLALERCMIPNNFRAFAFASFRIALEKICTSITSGWFREYAWENYNDVINLYDGGAYVSRFKDGLSNGIVKPYK